QEGSEPGCGERTLPQRMHEGPAQNVYRAHASAPRRSVDAEMFVNTPARINGSCRRHVMNVATEPHFVGVRANTWVVIPRWGSAPHSPEAASFSLRLATTPEQGRPE